MAEQRTIVFFPEGAHGPTSNCVAIGEVLRRRGHRVVFIVDEGFAGNLEASGFEEQTLRLSPEQEDGEAPDLFWSAFTEETAPIFRKSTLEQLSELVGPTWEALIEGAKDVDERLADILAGLEPHAIVEDNVVCFPAIPASRRPWVRLVSSNPAEIKDPAIPPFSSGYPTADRTYWRTFLDEVERTHRPIWEDFNSFVQTRGAAGLTWHETGPDFIHESPWLNLWVYPGEIDYPRARPLAPTWHRLDSIVTGEHGGWTLPGSLPDRGGALVYLSLGSVGSADVELVQRVVDVLGRTPHRVIVSMGPRADEITLHENMTGEAFLPQAAILPGVDLVITHGANDAVTEALHHGKPMVVLPLFWDQADNAQRVHETGVGVRLSTHGFRDAELTGAIDRLFSDPELRSRLEAMSGRIQAEPGAVKAADLIERVAVTGEPVRR